MFADLIIIGVLVLFVVLGYRAGFVKTCVNAASYVLSLFLSFFLYRVVAVILVKTPLYDFLVKTVGKSLAEGDSAGFLAGYLGGGSEVVNDGLAGAAALLIINVISFILVVILCKVLISLLAKVIDIFTKLPVIKQFNNVGGAVMGAVVGVVVVFLVLAAVLVFAPMLEDTFIMNQIEGSTLTYAMYENNFLVSLIK